MSDIIKMRTVSLCSRIFNVDSSARDLCVHFLSRYLKEDFLCPGTLVERLVSQNLYPLKAAFFPCKLYAGLKMKQSNEDGVVDSLRALIYNENLIKPYGDEHLLVRMLTRSFG